MADQPTDRRKYKQALTHVLDELAVVPYEDRARRDELYNRAREFEELMAMRHKVKEGRPRGTTKKKIIEASKARAQALKQPLNPGVAAFREKFEPKEPKEPL